MTLCYDWWSYPLYGLEGGGCGGSLPSSPLSFSESVDAAPFVAKVEVIAGKIRSHVKYVYMYDRLASNLRVPQM